MIADGFSDVKGLLLVDRYLDSPSLWDFIFKVLFLFCVQISTPKLLTLNMVVNPSAWISGAPQKPSEDP